MSRFFFDIDDGDRFVRDEIGHVFEDREAMRLEAIKALPEIARDELPDGNRRRFSVRVRDMEGRYLFQATLTMAAEWLDQPRM
ncbi:MAG: DUF6894 family protein [Rhizobiaceae bacterium]